MLEAPHLVLARVKQPTGRLRRDGYKEAIKRVF